MTLEQIVSAIQNNIHTGLRGVGNFTYPLEQIADEVKLERTKIIKEYSLKGILPTQDLKQKIACVPVDCDDLAKCCGESLIPQRHFEIPRLSVAYGIDSIRVFSVDMQLEFKVYQDLSFKRKKYRRYGADEPSIYLDLTPNAEGKLDAYIFDNNLIEIVSVEAIWEDPDQLKEYQCCQDAEFDPTGFLTVDIISRVTEKYVRYYRQMQTPIQPNTQTSVI